MRGCVGLALLSLTCTCFADQRVTIDSVSPASGSVAGGTLVTLKTRGVVGDLKDNARVYFGDSRAEVVDFRRDDGALLCFAPPSSIQKKVTITVDATSRISCMGCTFEYSMQLTPYISSVSVTYPPLSTSKDAPMGRLSATHCTPPLEVVSQLRLEMQLAGLNAVPELLVRLHSAGEVDSRLVCTAVQSISEQSLYAIDCELAQVQAGAYNLSLSVPNLGAAQFKSTILRPQLGLATHAMFILLPSLSSIQPQHGSVFGGGVVTIRGSGFSMDAQEVSVSLSGVECDVTHADPTKILCVPQAVSGVKRLRQRPAAGSNSMVGSATGEARLAMNSTQDANSTRAPITQDTNSTRAPITQDTNSTRAPITFPPSSANPSSAATVELSPAAQTDTPTQTYIQSATNTPTVTGTFLGDGEEMRGSRGASLLMWRTGETISSAHSYQWSRPLAVEPSDVPQSNQSFELLIDALFDVPLDGNYSFDLLGTADAVLSLSNDTSRTNLRTLVELRSSGQNKPPHHSRAALPIWLGEGSLLRLQLRVSTFTSRSSIRAGALLSGSPFAPGSYESRLVTLRTPSDSGEVHRLIVTDPTAPYFISLPNYGSYRRFVPGNATSSEITTSLRALYAESSCTDVTGNVTRSGQPYVAWQISFGCLGRGFPPVQLSPASDGGLAAEASIVRDGAGPAGGCLLLKLDGSNEEASACVPVNASAAEVQSAFNQLGVTDANVEIGDWTGGGWFVESAAPFSLSVDTQQVSGYLVSADIAQLSVASAFGARLFPISSAHLSRPAASLSADVRVKGFEASCDAPLGCSWEPSARVSTRVTSWSPLAVQNGTTVRFSVDLPTQWDRHLPRGASIPSVSVKVGSAKCFIDSFEIDGTNGTILCHIGPGIHGIFLPQISFDAYGDAFLSNDVPSVLYMLGALNVVADPGPFTGGGMVTIRGSGFGTSEHDHHDCVRATIGGKECTIQLCAFTHVECYAPEAAQGDSGLSSQMELVEVYGLKMNAVTAGEYKYSKDITPVITEISPQLLSSAVSTTVQLQGANLGRDAAKLSVMFGTSPCVVVSLSNAQATCIFSPSGVAQKNVYADVYVGTSRATVEVSVDIHFEITSVYPMIGSILGGTILTIDGRGFTADGLGMRTDAITLSLQADQVELPLEILPAESGIRPEAVGGAARIVAVTNTSALSSRRAFDIGASISAQVVLKSGGQRASCADDGKACQFMLSGSTTPIVHNVDPSWADAEAVAILTITGEHFVPDDGLYKTPQVFVGSTPCSILDHEATRIKCALEAAPATSSPLLLWVSPFGYGASTNITVQRALSIASASPELGTFGAATVTLRGAGFSGDVQSNQVIVDGVPARIERATFYELVLRPPMHAASMPNQVLYELLPRLTKHSFSSQQGISLDPIDQWSARPASSTSLRDTFAMNGSSTGLAPPRLIAVSPPGGDRGVTLTITGSGFGSPPVEWHTRRRQDYASSTIDTGVTTDFPEYSVHVGGVRCVVPDGHWSDTQVRCVLRDVSAGEHKISVVANGRRAVPELASSGVSFMSALAVSSISPLQGGFSGGIELTVSGVGLNAEALRVSVCKLDCPIVRAAYSQVVCTAPQLRSSSTASAFESDSFILSPHKCEVEVFVKDTPSLSPVVATQHYTLEYKLTPVVTSINPMRGTTFGGTTVTIVGVGFASNNTAVELGGMPCNVLDANQTVIVCTTSAVPAGRSTESTRSRTVHVGVIGTSQPLWTAWNRASVSWRYLDLWSERDTWPGAGVPTTGASVHIPSWQTILMDVSPATIGELLIEGELIFDNRDLKLGANSIVITGGRLEAGTADAPFVHSAVITMGCAPAASCVESRSIIVDNGADGRAGVLSLHGQSEHKSWVELGRTASAGSAHIELPSEEMHFAAGDRLVVTSVSKDRAEEVQVVSVTGAIVTLAGLLSSAHPAIQQRVGSSLDWTETRTVAARLNRNMAIHATDDQNNLGLTILVVGASSLEFDGIEVSNCGRAPLLGVSPPRACIEASSRPIAESYIRRSSIHNGADGGILARNSTKLHVSDTVIHGTTRFGVMLEETRYGSAAFVEKTIVTSTKAGIDGAASAFWSRSAVHVMLQNVAANSAGDGFRLEFRQAGSGSVCQRHTPFGAFQANRAHGVVHDALRIDADWQASSLEQCGIGEDATALLQGFIGWGNGRCGFVVADANVQLADMRCIDNIGDDLVWDLRYSSNGPRDAAVTQRRRSLPPHLKAFTAVAGKDGLDGKRGLVVPRRGEFLVHGASFTGYTSGAAIAGPHVCERHDPKTSSARTPSTDPTFLVLGGENPTHDVCDLGATVRMHSLEFKDVQQRVAFGGPLDPMLIDIDGTLGGRVGASVIRASQFNFWPGCSVGSAQLGRALICPPAIPLSWIRLANMSTEFLSVGSRASGCDGCAECASCAVYLNCRGPDCARLEGAAKCEQDCAACSPCLSSPDLNASSGLTSTFLHGTQTAISTDPSKSLDCWPTPMSLSRSYDVLSDHSFRSAEVHWMASAPKCRRSDCHEWLRLAFAVQEPPWRVVVQPLSEQDMSEPQYGGIQPPGPLDPFRTSYVNRAKRVLHVAAVLTNNGGHSGMHISIFPFSLVGTTKLPPLLPPPHISLPRRWSDPATWTNLGLVMPHTGVDVVIPAGAHVLLDISPPALGKLDVKGTLSFLDSSDLKLDATSLIVSGWLEVGSEEWPHAHRAELVLRGDDARLDVSGSLSLFGAPFISWTNLARSASAGDTNIFLQAAPNWVAGQSIMLTSWDPYASTSPSDSNPPVHVLHETVRIALCDGSRIELEQPLKHSHLVMDVSASGDFSPLQLRPRVGMIDRSVLVSAHGGIHVSGSPSSNSSVSLPGRASLSFVQMQHTSIFFQEVPSASSMPSMISGCVTIEPAGVAISGSRSRLVVSNNIVLTTVAGSAIYVDADAEVHHNLLIQRSRSIRWATNSSTAQIQPILNAGRAAKLSGNVVLGLSGVGLAFQPTSCKTEPIPTDQEPNEVLGTDVGMLLSAAAPDTTCTYVSNLVIVGANQIGLLAIGLSSDLQVRNVVLADNHIGASLNFARAGAGRYVRIERSTILGSPFGGECSHNAPVPSVLGASWHTVGILSPQYLDAVKTPALAMPKPCAMPWEARYGQPPIDGTQAGLNAKLELVSVAFGYFHSVASPCERRSTAYALNPTQGDFIPTAHFGEIQWHETDESARIFLGSVGASEFPLGADGPKFAAVIDESGDLTGDAGSTVLASNFVGVSAPVAIQNDGWAALRFRAASLVPVSTLIESISDSGDAANLGELQFDRMASTVVGWERAAQFVATGVAIDTCADRPVAKSQYLLTLAAQHRYAVQSAVMPQMGTSLQMYFYSASSSDAVVLELMLPNPKRMEVFTGELAAKSGTIDMSTSLRGTHSATDQHLSIVLRGGNDWQLPYSVLMRPAVWVRAKLKVGIEGFDEALFKAKLATAAAVDEAQVDVISVQSGSVIIEAAVYADSSDSLVQRTAQLTHMQDIAQQLVQAANDKTIDLGHATESTTVRGPLQSANDAAAVSSASDTSDQSFFDKWRNELRVAGAVMGCLLLLLCMIVCGYLASKRKKIQVYTAPEDEDVPRTALRSKRKASEFGKPLTELCALANSAPEHDIDAKGHGTAGLARSFAVLLQYFVAYPHSMSQRELFVAPGNDKQISSLREALDSPRSVTSASHPNVKGQAATAVDGQTRGAAAEAPSTVAVGIPTPPANVWLRYSAHTVGITLRTWLNELPNGLLTGPCKAQLIAAASSLGENGQPDDAAVDAIRSAIAELSAVHRAHFHALMWLLARVATRSADNEMTPKSLAKAFAPRLVKLDTEHGKIRLGGDQALAKTLAAMLTSVPLEKDETPEACATRSINRFFSPSWHLKSIDGTTDFGVYDTAHPERSLEASLRKENNTKPKLTPEETAVQQVEPSRGVRGCARLKRPKKEKIPKESEATTPDAEQTTPAGPEVSQSAVGSEPQNANVVSDSTEKVAQGPEAESLPPDAADNVAPASESVGASPQKDTASHDPTTSKEEDGNVLASLLALPPSP